jgi:hypothetical protein
MLHILLHFVSVALFAVTVSASGTLSSYTTTCIVNHSEGKDDTPNFLNAFSRCSKDATIVFREGINYNAWTPVQFHNLSNVKVLVQGNIHLPSDVATIQDKINSTSNPRSTYATPWFYFQGDKVQILGSKKPKWGQFQSYGQQVKFTPDHFLFASLHACFSGGTTVSASFALSWRHLTLQMAC